MKLDKTSKIRLLIAIVVGLPATLLLGAIAVIGLTVTSTMLVDGNMGAANSRATDFLVLSTFAKSVGGCLGIVGFWIWIFSPRAGSRVAAAIAIPAMLCGELAVISVAMQVAQTPGQELDKLLAALGLLALLTAATGLYACFSLAKATYFRDVGGSAANVSALARRQPD